MVEKTNNTNTNKKHKTSSLTQDDISNLLQRYNATTVLTLLQELAHCADSKIDWDALVKNTSTGISDAREYHMLWRHLAYHHALLDSFQYANIGSNSDPLLKINLSHPSRIPPPRPTPLPTIDSNLQPQPQDPFHLPKWFSEREISEEKRYECSVYGEMLLDRYNQVKGTDFEFVRLVKVMESVAAGFNFKIQFKAKSSAAAAAAKCTLKTFEGFVFKYWVGVLQ